MIKIRFNKSYEPWCYDDYDTKCPFSTLDKQGFVIPVGSFDCQKCKYNDFIGEHLGKHYVWCKRIFPSVKGIFKRIKLRIRK